MHHIDSCSQSSDLDLLYKPYCSARPDIKFVMYGNILVKIAFFLVKPIIFYFLYKNNPFKNSIKVFATKYMHSSSVEFS